MTVLSDLIGNRVAAVLSSDDSHKVHLLQPWDLYPELFCEEAKRAEEENKQMAIAEQSSSRHAYAAAVNSYRKGGDNA